MAEKIDNKNTPENLGTTSAWERDREIARKSPKNVVVSIPGAFVRTHKIGGLIYYQLVKSYRVGDKIKQKLLVHYGVRPPRSKK